MGSFDRLRFPDACNAIIFNPEKELLLVQVRFKDNQWYLPGGLVERGQSSWAACVKNVHDELGIQVQVASLLAVFHRPNKDANVFLFECTAKDFHFKPSDEVMAVKFFKTDNLPTPIGEQTYDRIQTALTGTKISLKSQIED